jgi:hypothetical protein
VEIRDNKEILDILKLTTKFINEECAAKMYDYRNYYKELKAQVENTAKQLETVRGMCDNPDSVDACGLISKRL